MIEEEGDLSALEERCGKAVDLLLARREWQLLDRNEFRRRALDYLREGIATDAQRDIDAFFERILVCPQALRQFVESRCHISQLFPHGQRDLITQQIYVPVRFRVADDGQLLIDLRSLLLSHLHFLLRRYTARRRPDYEREGEKYSFHMGSRGKFSRSKSKSYSKLLQFGST